MIRRLRVRRLSEWSDSAGVSKLTLRLRIASSRHHHEALAEGVFRKIFCCERKRAERSGRCFLLMLVDVESVLQAHQSEGTLAKIVSALSCSTRETDIAGWYRERATLGVIFTELGNGNREVLPDLTRAKVIASLQAKLSAEQLNQIHISFHFFPENWNKSSLGRFANTKLYPDLFEQDEARKFSRFLKRSMDIVGSIAALIFCSPLFVVISLAIKLTSKGTVLFKQQSVGRYGLRFTFLKFRSMECVNDPSINREYIRRFIAGEADSARVGNNQHAVYKIQDDPRVTRIGKF